MNKYNSLRTYKHYPKYISTLILTDYIAKYYDKSDTGPFEFLIDDLVFNFYLSDKCVTECYITKDNKYYDYFCRGYATPRLKTNENI